MIRNLLLCTLSMLFYTIGYAQAINHIDYGEEGLVIGINENYAMDIDDDGVVDFYINAWEDELGFSPIFAIGCFASESYYEYTNWGSKVLQVFNEGDILRIDDSNMYDYLDDGRGSAYQSAGGGETAEGWVNGVANYIGFAVFTTGEFSVTNGWMKVKMDTENEELIILEYAYHDFVPDIGEGSITVGDRGIVNVQDLDNVLSSVSVTPNPAHDLFSINYTYQGKADINISIFDNVGKEVLRTSGNGLSSLVFDSSNWTSGLYYVNFNTTNGVHTERIMINR